MRLPAERTDRAAALVLLLQLVLLLHGAWKVGPTFDEHFYAASGAAYWHEGDFAINREHPPLVKLLAAAPLLVAPGVAYPEHALETVNFPVAFFYQHNAADLDRNLFLARLPVCLLTVATALGVFLAGRRFFGGKAALCGLVAFAFQPSVLAHGRLVSLDAGVMPFLFFAVLAFLALLEEPTWRRTLVAALLFGLANLAKFTALLLIPFLGFLAVVRCARTRSARPLGSLALTFLGGLGVFALGYGFEAKSINAAWGSEFFARDVPPGKVELADLAAALRDAGGAEAQAQQIERAPSVDFAARTLIDYAGEEATAELAARTLRGLAGGPGELRKLAFAAVLEAEHLSAEVRDDTLAALADRRFPDDAGWRRFWAEHGAESWDRVIFYHGWMRALTSGLFGDDRPIPLLTALKGLDQTLAHGKLGHGSYFRGKTLLPGRDFAEGNPHPEYYAVVMAVKNPLAWLVLAVGGIVCAFLPNRKRGRERGWTVLRAAALVGFPVFAFLAFSNGKALLGVRYLLPLYPFLCLAVGCAAVRFPRAALALAAVAALEAIWIHPHQLMYYNVLAGGPSGGPAITCVGDDWGQDARAAGRFLARYRDEIDAAGGLVYRPYTMADPAALGLQDCRPHTGPVEGIVAVHAVDYHREADEFAWLRPYEPFAKLGHAVWLYDTRGGPPGRDPREEWE